MFRVTVVENAIPEGWLIFCSCPDYHIVIQYAILETKMIIRIYESGKLDLETVGDMLWQADAQANFHPEARWINSSSFASEEDWISPESKKVRKGRIFREFSIRWIGRESVIMWLTSNQILFQIISYKMLPEEQEAIDGTLADRGLSEPITHIN